MSGVNGSPLTLQAMMEKVVLLRKAVELQRKRYEPSVSERLRKMLWQYASLLASQGALETAYSYLVEDNDVCGWGLYSNGCGLPPCVMMSLSLSL